MKKVILVIGLEQKEVIQLRQLFGFQYNILHYEMLPMLKLIEGLLWVESANIMGKWIAVDKVIFHGIFENDYDVLTMLSLWNGDCLPNPFGMLDLRQRIPGLARALQVSSFKGTPKSMLIGESEIVSEKEVVAKWGIWHCGEDKHKFVGKWRSSETSVIEEFIKGEAVRVMLVGEKAWQIKLAGNDWLKSIHHNEAICMPIDEMLLYDAKKLSKHFDNPIIGVDYMVGEDGEKYLLEVNHIPNVTVFDFINEAYIEFVFNWLSV